MDLGWVAAGLAVYLTLFGLEFVDRTNMMVVTLSSKRNPRYVWLGASFGFIVSTAIAVFIGALFLDLLVHDIFYVRLGGGIFVLGFGLWSLLRHREDEETVREVGTHQVVLQAFLIILLLEMGDDTQILTVLFVASLGNALLVFGAASLGLITTAAVGARAGAYLRKRVSPRLLERVSASIIITVGAVLILYALFPFF